MFSTTFSALFNHHYLLLAVIFFVYVFALTLDEIHQWLDDLRKGVTHFNEKKNVLDVGLWGFLSLANSLRIWSSMYCSTSFLELGPDEFYEEEQGEGPLDAVIRRGLRGGGSSRGGSAEEHYAYSDDSARPVGTTERLAATPYGGSCISQDVAQVILCVCVIVAFVRPLDASVVDRKFGVLSIIIMRLTDDIIVFIVYAFICIFGCGTAFVGLMPGLGDGPFSVDGAFFAPFWAMYGEFGDLAEVGSNAGPIGVCLLWLYTFVSQIVLINLLIAMMTE